MDESESYGIDSDESELGMTVTEMNDKIQE